MGRVRELNRRIELLEPCNRTWKRRQQGETQRREAKESRQRACKMGQVSALSPASKPCSLSCRFVSLYIFHYILLNCILSSYEIISQLCLCKVPVPVCLFVFLTKNEVPATAEVKKVKSGRPSGELVVLGCTGGPEEQGSRGTHGNAPLCSARGACCGCPPYWRRCPSSRSAPSARCGASRSQNLAASDGWWEGWSAPQSWLGPRQSLSDRGFSKRILSFFLPP